MDSEFRHLAEYVRRDVDETLQRSGILFRAFGRGKSIHSLNSKIDKNPGKYSVGGKLIQDAIGVRVALYFFEDTPIVEGILRTRYELDGSASIVDHHDSDQFTVTRHNLIFRVPLEYVSDMARVIGPRPIDRTFEVQIRSILSEGWHEVDHDLRYKCRSSWENQGDLDRALNGILATLETSEWSMKKIFDDLAYRHYKSGNWVGMLHNKFRMRASFELGEEFALVLKSDLLLAKEILRVSRQDVIGRISLATPKVPVTLDNILCIANCVGPKDLNLLDITSSVLKDAIGFNA